MFRPSLISNASRNDFDYRLRLRAARLRDGVDIAATLSQQLLLLASCRFHLTSRAFLVFVYTPTAAGAPRAHHMVPDLPPATPPPLKNGLPRAQMLMPMTTPIDSHVVTSAERISRLFAALSTRCRQ